MKRPWDRVPEMAYPELRAIRLALKDRIVRAKDMRQLPRSTWLNHKRQVTYTVYVHLDLATGEVSAACHIEGFRWLTRAPADPDAVRDWMLTSGLQLVRDVDRVLGRDRFSPPLAGRTILIPEDP